jgi:hypothetical protein
MNAVCSLHPIYLERGGTAMDNSHGTPYSTFNPGQTAEVSSAVDKALPKALNGMDPKIVISAVQKNGKLLEAELRRAFLAAINALPRIKVESTFKAYFGFQLTDDLRGPIELMIDSLELGSLVDDYLGNHFGLRHAEALLAHQDALPKEWDRYVLLFPGTTIKDVNKCSMTACLKKEGNKWIICFEKNIDFYRRTSSEEQKYRLLRFRTKKIKKIEFVVFE